MKVIGEAEKTFEEADVNKNGVLNEAEFIDFIMKMKASAEERQDFVPDYTEAHMKEGYAAINKLEPNKNGIRLDEIVMARLFIAMI